MILPPPPPTNEDVFRTHQSNEEDLIRRDATLAEQFRHLVDRAYSTSPFYHALCHALCQDEVLLSRLAQTTAPSQKKAGLLLAGVQWLLNTSHPRHPLAV